MAQPGGAPREERITRELTQSTILFGRQGIRQTDPDYFPLAVASYILGGGSTGRLYGRVRDQGGLAYSVYSYVNPGRFGASIILGAQTRIAEVPTVINLIRQEAERIGREPVSDRELDLARSYLVGSFPLRLDTTRKVSDFIVSVEEQGLGLDYPDRYIAQIRRVTAADVQRVAAKYFAPNTFNLVVVGGEVK
jgi:zinc protease